MATTLPASERQPPASIEAEMLLIGACLLDPDAIDEVGTICRPDDFYRANHEVMIRRLLAMRAEGVPIDAVSFALALERHGELERAGGDDAIYEALDATPHAANAAYHAQVVRQSADARRLIEACTETLKEAYSRQYSIHDLTARAEERIFAIGEREASDGTRTIDHFAREAMDRYNARREGRIQCVRSGFRGLDFILDGFFPGQLIYLAARTSVGKTAFGLNIIENAAVRDGMPTLMVSLEMAGREQAERLLSSGALVDSHKLRRGEPLDDGEREAIQATYKRLCACPHLFLDDSPMRTVGHVSANARRLKRRVGLRLLVVDYLQLIDSLQELGKKASREERVSYVSRRLKILAKELDIPVLCLSQLNRESEKREGNRPRTSDLRESGSLEQDADVVLLLHRPEMTGEGGPTGEAELIVSKNRAGPRGTVKLTYRGPYCRFEDYEADPDYIPPPAEEDGDRPF